MCAICVYVCMYVCTVISPKAGWILREYWQQIHIPTHPRTRRYTLINTRTARPIPPPRGVLSQELNGVGWPVPFPLRTAHNQVMMKCFTWLKVASTNLIYLPTHKLTIIISQPVSWLWEGSALYSYLSMVVIFKERIPFIKQRFKWIKCVPVLN
jgi:hypothetical protein